VEDVSPRARHPALTPATTAIVAGVLGWAVGSLAFPAGLGTLVLAAGLLAAGWLYRAGRRQAVIRPPLPTGARGRLVRLALFGGLLLGAAVVGLNAVGYGELVVPAAATILGVCLVPAAGLLDRRGCLPLGAALMLLGAGGALLALRSVGEVYPMGLVGLGCGALLWAAAVVEVGLHRKPPARIRSR
jgi:hypothetical protein